MGDVSPEIAVFLGQTASAFVRQDEVGLRGSLVWPKGLGVGATLSYLPDRGQADWTRLADDGRSEWRVFPEAIKQHYCASIDGRWSPATATWGLNDRWHASAIVVFGLGMTRATRTGLAPDWEPRVITGSYPAASAALELQVWGRRGFGFGLQWGSRVWVEDVDGGLRSAQHPEVARVLLLWGHSAGRGADQEPPNER